MFGFRFIKFQPNEYVLRYRGNKIIQQGNGLSFNYFAPRTSLVVVPTKSTEVPFMFDEVTVDFQEVNIQGQTTFRIKDPKQLSELLNYSVDSYSTKYISDDPTKISKRIVNLVRVLIKKSLNQLKLKEAIQASEILAKKILEEIRQDDEVKMFGVEIMGLSILAISPNKETARALEAQTREEILKAADIAIYERRNSSIEQERIVKENELATELAIENKQREIKENELATEIAVEHKQREILQTKLETRMIEQQKQAEIDAERIKGDTELESQRKKLIKMQVENAKEMSDAKAYELTASMKALEGVSPDVIQSLANMDMEPNKLIAMAFKDIGEKADKIGQLNITPDLLQELLKNK